MLREVVEEVLTMPAAKDVVAGLHFARRLTVLPADTAERLRSHPELDAMLTDLVFVGDDEGLAELVEGQGSVEDWGHALDVLDSSSLYENLPRPCIDEGGHGPTGERCASPPLAEGAIRPCLPGEVR